MNPQVFIETPDNFITLLDAEVDKVVDGARDKLGSQTEGPMTTLVALMLLRAFGYDCPPTRLWNIVQSGRVPEPSSFGCEYAWHNEDIARVIRVLHDERKWLPGFHRQSKSKRELEKEDRLLKQCEDSLAYYGSLETDELELRYGQAHDQAVKGVIGIVLRDRLAESDAQDSTEASNARD